MRGAIPLALLAAVSAGTATALPGQEHERRPNILWIVGEDLGPELGCYGTLEVSTPNLDALAGVGVRYTRAFTVTPVCSTSRSSFMTGMYAQTIGAHHHRTPNDQKQPLPDGVKTICDWLRGAGYFTANVVQLARQGDDAKFYKGTGKTDWNFAYAGKRFDGRKWDELKANQPFFAQINFPETHRGGAWNGAHKHIDRRADPNKVVIPPYYPDHPVTREDWAQYLDTVMALDKKVGYVLARLQEDGLTDDTIVLFTGDHGRAHVRGKQWPYESGLHVPMLLRWPKNFKAPPQIEPGTVDGRLIASIDWTATLLWAAGVEHPRLMQGRVFLGPDAKQTERHYLFAGRDRGDETVDRIRTVRSHRYRYIRNFYPERPFLQLNRYKERTYPVLQLMRILFEQGQLRGPAARLMLPTRPAEELYDLEADPYEVRNLAKSAQHAEVLAHLRGALYGWIEAIDDQGRFPEDPAIAARIDRQAAQRSRGKIEALRAKVLERVRSGK